METPQKPVVNGLDSSPAASGFRHQLPQIPVMSRNPKIAQSKGSTKSDVVVTEHEHSTTDVEGVGKVVHIGNTTNLLFHIDHEHRDENNNVDKAVVSKKQTQPTIHTLFGSKNLGRLSKPKQEEVDEAVLKLIVGKCLPISIVRNRHFIHLTGLLDPRYKILSQQNVVKSLVKKQEDVRGKLLLDLKTATDVALTHDGWTSCATESFSAVTAHFIDPQWNLKAAVLQTKKVEGSHTAENIARSLEGSEVMEVDDSVDKMIDQLDKSNDVKEKIIENGTREEKVEEKCVENIDEVGKLAEKNQDSVNDKKVSDKSDAEKLDGEVDKTNDESESKQKAAVNTGTPEKSAETETKTESGNASKKSRRVKNKAADLDKSATSSDESPTKRQRKPKVFEDESETVPKTPKSPVEKSVKQKPVVTPELEAKYPVKWFVGDLVWAKVASHPWWPCMVSYDPFTAVYTRIGRTREYHVQFFGDAAERAWISMYNLLDFHGKAKFDEYVEGVYAASKSSKELKRLKKWYGIQANRLNAVNVGINQAEEALKMDKQERRANYTFVYKLPKSKVSETVSAKLSELDEDLKIIHGGDKQTSVPSEAKSTKKRKLDEVETPKMEKTAAKRRKIETSNSPEKSESPTKSGRKPGGSKAGTEGSFEVFCQKERENVLVEHPEFTDENLMDYCKQQWCMMSKKQKARYKSKYTEDSDISKSKTKNEQDISQEQSPNSGRKRKPSKKVIEAEEDNKAVDEVISGKKPSTPVASKSRKSTSTPKDSKTKKSRASLPKSGQTPSTADTEEKVRVEPKKRGRPCKIATEDSTVALPGPSEAEITDSSAKPGTSGSDNEAEKSQTATVIPARRARPKKSVSTDSDRQSESGRSTRSPSPEQITSVKRVKEEYEYEMEIYKLSSTGPQKKENLCQICEQTGELVECQGPCQGFFHTDCLGLTTAPTESFKCDECSSGIHTCFACKKASAETQRCTVPVCGKFYHVDCVKKFSQAKVEGKGITCPLHSCHTCLAHNRKGTASRSNGRLLRCVRCPTAYHVGDFCISAGSINLTGLNIVCARHFQPIPTLKHHSRVHVSWCFSCNKGGTLLCCEYCPAAYHAECLNIEFPTGSWYCSDCVKGKQPLYGEIIWVKLGNYRWWPGEICHPRNVPLNIQEKPHQVGEFPVHFLGSHEYFWLHQGRVFSYQDGDNGTTGWSSTKKGLAKHFAKGLKEASEAYKSWKEFRENREQMELAKESKKPAPFKTVKTNVPLGSVVIKKADLSELPKCECKPEQENPCGRDSECLNSMMMYECHPALCPVGDKCQNQFFTKRLYPPQQAYKTEGRGWGLKATADIKKGQFVNEYVGDLIDEEECRRRLEKSHEDDVHNFYMMTLDMDRIIDAGPKGNLSRFMNHSCDPNLETQKWNVNGDVRVGLFALKDIKEGEELTFNYNFDCLGNEQTKCQCGSENCSGYLGVRPKTQHAAMEEKKRKDTKKSDKLKKKKKPVVKHKHDDDCFRCGEGGELVMCDRASCTKSYHLRCLNLSKPPYGKWDCPWHHCDECGKPAPHKCTECPNSFCAVHSARNVKEFDGKTYCLEHDDLLETLSESRVHSSNASDDNGGQASDIDATEKSTNGKKENELKKGKAKEETLPPKKRGPKPSIDSGDKATNGAAMKSGKGRKGSKTEAGGKGSVSDDPLAVAPMFDDDEEEEFGLVIDIPNF